MIRMLNKIFSYHKPKSNLLWHNYVTTTW